MSSYQCRDPRVKDKTVLRPSYLQHGITIPGNTFFNIELVLKQKYFGQAMSVPWLMVPWLLAS